MATVLDAGRGLAGYLRGHRSAQILEVLILLKNAGDARVLSGNIGLTRGHRTEHKRQRRSETGGGARPAWAPATLRVYPNSSDQESSIGVACGEHITEMA